VNGNAWRRSDRQRTGDEIDARAATPCGGGKRYTHLSAAVIRDESNGIDRFARRTGCDEHTLSREPSVGLEDSADVGEDRLWFRHATRPTSLARGQHAVVRIDDSIPELAEMHDVASRLRMCPHLIVHRWHEQHWTRGRQ